MADDLPFLRIDGAEIGVRAAVRTAKIAGGFSEFLSTIVGTTIVRRAAERLGVRVSNQALQEASDTERRAMGLYSAADTNAWLKESAYTLEDWEAALEYRLLRRELVERVHGPGSIEARFRARADAYTVAAISVISLDSRAKGQEIADQIAGQEATFAELARKHSTDPASREAGGLLGWVTLESLPPAIRAAVQGSAGKGEVVGPVEADGSWHLIQVDAIRRPELTAEIREEIRELLLDEWLEEERKRARVDLLFAP